MFRVTLAPASTQTVTVVYATGDATAVAGADYEAKAGTLTFAADETEKTVEVTTLADGHDDAGETLTLSLSEPQGATIGDGEASGTITNTGAMPRAWLARFGRTVAEQVLGAVEDRIAASRAPGSQVSVAGSVWRWRRPSSTRRTRRGCAWRRGRGRCAGRARRGRASRRAS